MTEKTCPRPVGETGNAGGNSGRPYRSTFAPTFNPDIDGFACCWCGARHPWTAVGCFDGRRRWCDQCCDQFERIVNPPVFEEGAA